MFQHGISTSVNICKGSRGSLMFLRIGSSAGQTSHPPQREWAGGTSRPTQALARAYVPSVLKPASSNRPDTAPGRTQPSPRVCWSRAAQL